MEGMGEGPNIGQEKREEAVSEQSISDEARYTLWDRIVDFFYFNDYYIVVFILSILLIYWALK